MERVEGAGQGEDEERRRRGWRRPGCAPAIKKKLVDCKFRFRLLVLVFVSRRSDGRSGQVEEGGVYASSSEDHPLDVKKCSSL